MEKLKTRYICQNCGYTSLHWLGKCPSCQQWDTFVEEIIAEERRPKDNIAVDSKIYSLAEIETVSSKRVSAGVFEFDRLLGGGLVPGSVTLLGGEPGIGKSTLLLQIAGGLADKEMPVLYVSGEESIEQTKLRAERLNIQSPGLYLLSETNEDKIEVHIAKLKPKIVVIDSIQIMYISSLASSPGSVGQVREAASALTLLAKKNGIILLLIGHITKNGAIAGPKVIEHIVDTVLYFEGGLHNKYRILRAVKNRFGSTEEIGIFRMYSDGLHEVVNPSEIFLNTQGVKTAGSIVVTAIEGMRPIMVELQALVAPAVFGMPERKAIGMDYKRLAVLLAVLEKRAGLRLQNQDVFVNIAGGIKLSEPALDLGAALSIVSSFREIPIPIGTVAIGEVGLGGEIRSVKEIERRIIEAQRLGFREVIVPDANKEKITRKIDIKLIRINTISDAVEYVFSGKKI